MKKSDNEILKKTLLHYINLEYYANGLDEEFQLLLTELQECCMKVIEAQKSIATKKEYNVLYKLINEEVDKFEKELEERLEEQAEIIMNQELNFLDNVYNKESEFEENKKSSTLTNAALALSGVSLAKILFAPIDGRDTTTQFVERTGKNILRSYDTLLRAGYLFGQKSEDINSQLANRMKQIARGMQSGIRTAIPSFAKTTDRIVFLNNNVEVVWVATLDGRTCITCASLSGLHFKSISEAPSVPQHNMCRCILCPTKDLTEPVPEFKEFIEMLDEKDQKTVLGKYRYELWKKYDISLEKFTNSGTVVSKDELEQILRREENKNLIIPDEKFTDYALNPEKSKGKAEVFESALGYTLDNYKGLKENILNNLNQKDMHFVEEDEFGKRYRCDLKITGPNGNTAEIRTGWIKEPDSDELRLRLTTVYAR